MEFTRIFMTQFLDNWASAEQNDRDLGGKATKLCLGGHSSVVMMESADLRQRNYFSLSFDLSPERRVLG